LFKGAGANILRGVAGAGVLSLYDKLQQVMFGKVYSGGMLSYLREVFSSNIFFTRVWLNQPAPCRKLIHTLYHSTPCYPLVLGMPILYSVEAYQYTAMSGGHFLVF
jgi:hypothetical protein